MPRAPANDAPKIADREAEKGNQPVKKPNREGGVGRRGLPRSTQEDEELGEEAAERFEEAEGEKEKAEGPG